MKDDSCFRNGKVSVPLTAGCAVPRFRRLPCLIKYKPEPLPMGHLPVLREAPARTLSERIQSFGEPGTLPQQKSRGNDRQGEQRHADLAADHGSPRCGASCLHWGIQERLSAEEAPGGAR